MKPSLLPMAAANDGDTILVHTGVYDEAVVVNKKVSIIGVPSEVGAKLVQKSGAQRVHCDRSHG